MEGMEYVIQLGDLAKAVTAIGALVAAIMVKPYLRKSQREKELAETIKGIHKELKDVKRQLGDLQYERLSQSHDFYTNVQGWCPASKKQQLCNMYRDYRRDGTRNHLTEHYEAEIFALPEHPIHN